jgi:hypothetical protein
MTGQVATTIKEAQIMEMRNGRRIQKLDAMSTPIKSTARIVWIRS